MQFDGRGNVYRSNSNLADSLVAPDSNLAADFIATTSVTNQVLEKCEIFKKFKTFCFNMCDTSFYSIANL